MKSNSLFGVQFAENQFWKKTLLNHYTSWKSDKISAYLKASSSRLDLSFPGISKKESVDLLAAHLADVQKSLPFFEEVERLVSEDGCRHYYITGSVLSNCEKLKTKEPFDLGWLAPVRDGKRQLNFGSQFIRFQKTGARISAVSAILVEREDKDYLQYTFFNMDLVHKYQSEPFTLNPYEEDDCDISSADFEHASKKLFFQLITFLELAPIEEVFLPAGGKHGTRKSECRLLNETDFPIIIVTTRWNRAIHVGRIEVRGHYRLQPCGPGLQYRKLLWISDFYKHGYNLTAQKEKENWQSTVSSAKDH